MGRFDDIKRSVGPAELLSALGVDEAYHPQAAGEKRAQCLRCDGSQTNTMSIAPDGTGYGLWHCHRCGASGDAFDLAQKHLALSSKIELLQLYKAGLRSAVTRIQPRRQPHSTQPNSHTTIRRDLNLKKAEKLIRGSIPFRDSEIALCYLQSRGLSQSDFDDAVGGLLFHPAVPYWQQGTCSTHPALLAAINDINNRPIGLHLTYLAADGCDKAQLEPARKLHPSWIEGPIRGAVRLVEADPSLPLIVGEGIETVLSARALSAELPDGPYPCWAALNTSLLKQFKPHPKVSRIIIAADHDPSGAGEKAARFLADRLLEAGNLEVQISMPAEPGDWNDVLKRRNR